MVNTLVDLFKQLGQENSEGEIEAFINNHKLLKGEILSQAPFWNASQAEFIRKAWLDDSDWVGAIDELNNRLRD